jgi:hypothetical protein
MGPLVHNLYKKIADLEHGIEQRELESKMALRTPRGEEKSTRAPRVMSPTVIQPVSHGTSRNGQMNRSFESNIASETDTYQLLDKVQSLEFQLACAQRDKLKMQEEVESLSEKLSHAMVGMDRSKASAIDLHELAAERSELASKFVAAEIQIKDQQQLLDSMTEALGSLQKENDNLRFSLQELELKLIRASSDDTSSRLNLELQARCSSMERRLADVPSLERQVHDAMRQLEEERGRAGKALREISDLRRDLARSEQDAQEHRTKAAALTAEASQLRHELDKQTHQLQEQARKGDAAAQEAASVRSEFRQFREKAAAHQAKWRSERQSLMVRRAARPRRVFGCHPAQLLSAACTPATRVGASLILMAVERRRQTARPLRRRGSAGPGRLQARVRPMAAAPVA